MPPAAAAAAAAAAAWEGGGGGKGVVPLPPVEGSERRGEHVHAWGGKGVVPLPLLLPLLYLGVVPLPPSLIEAASTSRSRV